MILYFYVSTVFEDYLNAHYTPVAGSEVTKEFDEVNPFTGQVMHHITETQLLSALRAGWTKSGWEGDGEIEFVLLPPYIFDEDEVAWQPVFHVKQENNGTSYVASPVPLSSKSLKRM
jgi:hypothetical protein